MLLCALMIGLLAVSSAKDDKYEYEYFEDNYPYDDKYPVYKEEKYPAYKEEKYPVYKEEQHPVYIKHESKELKEKYDSPLDDEPKYQPVEKYEHEQAYEPYEPRHHDHYEPHYEPKYEKHDYKKTVKCYQCAYSPPRIIEEQVKVPVQDKHGKIYYKTKYVQKETPGGWDKCKGPFDDSQATKYGIDVWDCDSNCFTRTDKSGNVFRGCYRGEFGVEPEKLGCHEQAGSLYCFCKGNRCNYKRAKDLPDQDQYLVEELHRDEH